jgi:hypothetical protein
MLRNNGNRYCCKTLQQWESGSLFQHTITQRLEQSTFLEHVATMRIEVVGMRCFNNGEIVTTVTSDHICATVT